MASASTNHPLGIGGKPQGFTRIRHGRLEQREQQNDEWRGAVRLADVRNQLIQQAGAAGAYRFTPKAGDDRNDITSFHPTNQQWGPDRSDRAPILFQLRKTAAPGVVPQGFLQHGGRFVLDQDDHCIRDFPELPLTLSTALEGHDIELYRRQNDKIDYLDLIARMPSSSTRRGMANQPPPAPNSLQMRCKRFRLKAGCLSWLAREGTDELRVYLENLLGRHCVRQNSSVSFGRDLTKAEQDAWLAVNKGSNPERRRKANRSPSLEQESPDEDEADDEFEADEDDDEPDIKEEPVGSDSFPSNPSAKARKAVEKPRSRRSKQNTSYPFLQLPQEPSPASATTRPAKRRRRNSSGEDDEERSITPPPRRSQRSRRRPGQRMRPRRPFASDNRELVNMDREPGARSSELMWSRIFASQRVEEVEKEESETEL